jgi:Rieske Fe-S protein
MGLHLYRRWRGRHRGSDRGGLALDRSDEPGRLDQALSSIEVDYTKAVLGHQIVIGVCAHLGCISPFGEGARPAPKNLYLPPYAFESGGQVKIG